jgi:hypothetical protein
MQDTMIINQNQVDVSAYLVDGQNVRFDGCPDIVVNSSSTCAVASEQIVYNGPQVTAYDTGLAAFTGATTF